MHTRREIAIMGLAAVGMRAFAAKPDSRYGGVQIGVIVSPYNYREIPVRADELLKPLVDSGISAIELQDVRAEVYARAPAEIREGYSGSPTASPGSTPEERAALRKKKAEELKQWRLSAPLEKYRALRQLYADAGVKIYAFRLARVSQGFSDAEYEYFFRAAEALGADQITVELPYDPEVTKRVAQFAERYDIRMGYHNHEQVNAHSWDQALAQSNKNGINFDVGHYVAAINGSPIPFLEEHHDRITSLHLKDRKFRTNGGQNTLWGEGDTPLVEILRLMKARSYAFPAAIELEYPIPPGSTALQEISKCLQFCKSALA
jgi:sugar phosphate isomerase/epimerase